MDHRQFDDLTRTLARSRTRRGVFKGLAGGLAAGLAALGRRRPAAAQDGLRLDALICLGLFPRLAAQVCIALNLPHVARTGCVDGRCVILACQAGWANCDGRVETGCETPLGTQENCGACGETCAEGVPCSETAFTCCAPDCAGKACGADDGCGGVCLVGECPTGQACGYPDPGVCGCGPLGCVTCVGTGFVTSDNGQCIFRQCGSGTACRQVTDCTINCDFS